MTRVIILYYFLAMKNILDLFIVINILKKEKLTSVNCKKKRFNILTKTSNYKVKV